MEKRTRKTAARKVLAEEEGAAILRQREELALEELRQLGARISLYEEREFVPGDPLTGTEDRWLTGTCHVVFESTTGKRKTISERSAVAALADAQGWLGWNARLKPEHQFVILPNDAEREPDVFQRIGSEELRRREGRNVRVIGFTDGKAALVDAHGTPQSSEANARASAHR